MLCAYIQTLKKNFHFSEKKVLKNLYSIKLYIIFVLNKWDNNHLKKIEIMTTSQKLRLEKQLTGYAKVNVTIDDSSSTGVVYAFVGELSMYRIAEKMRTMSNFSYGFNKSLNSYYISLDLG